MSRGLAVGVCLICAVWFGVVAASAVAASPPNDDLANAQVLSGALPLTATGSNIEATSEVGEPTPPRVRSAGHSIWFRWEAPSSGDVSVNTCGSDIATALAIYRGSNLGALTLVGASNSGQSPDCLINGSEVLFNATAGTVYSISVDGVDFEPTEGDIELELDRPQPPSNDDFADAEPISAITEAIGSGFSFTNWGATKEPGEPAHRGNQGGASVWFEWTAPRSGGALFQACDPPSDEEALVAVYTGSAVGALTPVPQLAPTDGTCSYFFLADAGVTYRIAVDGQFDAPTGTGQTFQAAGSLRYVPGNDQFEDAYDLVDPAGHSYTRVGSSGFGNLGATKQPGEPDHAGNAGGASVWFKWTAPLTGSVQMNLCQAGFQTLLAAYTGSSVSALTTVASGSGVESGGCLTELKGTGQIGFNVDAGTTYDIAVDGRDGATGSFGLNLWTSNERLKRPAEPTATARRPAAATPAPTWKTCAKPSFLRSGRTEVLGESCARGRLVVTTAWRKPIKSGHLVRAFGFSCRRANHGRAAHVRCSKGKVAVRATGMLPIIFTGPRRDGR